MQIYNKSLPQKAVNISASAGIVFKLPSPFLCQQSEIVRYVLVFYCLYKCHISFCVCEKLDLHTYRLSHVFSMFFSHVLNQTFCWG